MKKLISILALFGVVGFTANAQNFVSQRLINAQSIYISNSVTFVTNLQSTAGIVSGGTNLVGVMWTNNFGQTETSTNITPAYTNSPSIATNIGASYNLCKSANLIYNRDGAYITLPSTNCCLFVHTQPAASGSANATNAFTIVLVGVPNPNPQFPLVGVDAPNVTASFSSTSATAVTGTKGLGWYFGFNTQLFAGCKQIMLYKVYTAVAPAAAASDFWIDDVEFCGSQP